MLIAALSWTAAAVLAQQSPTAQEVPDDYARHAAPEQPIPYSHRTHLALGLACESCHTGGQTTAQMGFPDNAICMSCHTAVAADRPSIRTLAELTAAGEQVPWVRVYEVLDGVSWSHQPHLAAGVACGACHGQVAQLDQMSMTTAVTAMASCIGCHESRAANTACVTCHSWPGP
jgi:hypothetical protein